MRGSRNLVAQRMTSSRPPSSSGSVKFVAIAAGAVAAGAAGVAGYASYDSDFRKTVIREAIEAGKDGDWDAVTVAHLKAKRLAEADLEKEKKARNSIAELVAETNLGGQGETTQLNPLVPISKTTAEKLSHELDEMISSVKYVDSERIFVHDYSDRVAESRKKFQLELKAVHPNLNYEEGMKLKSSDLQTILAHAHLRIDQLSQKLIDNKLNEEKRIKSIISKKKEDLLEKLCLEAQANVAVIPDHDKKKFDEELARANAEIQKKYDEKLKEVVRTQKQLYDIEHAKDVEEAVLKERNIHSSVIGKALAQLEGIEKALSEHLQMDIQNRKAKQMWLATQNLKETVVFGNRASCYLYSCAGYDKFIKTIDSSMAKVSKVHGEYTEEDLNTRFNKICRIGRRVAYVREGGALVHLYSWLKSSLTIQLTPTNVSDRLTPAAETNFILLTRAEQLWKSGKKGDAIRVLQMTDGATRRVAADFIEDARRQQETIFLSRLLLAHAALTSILIKDPFIDIFEGNGIHLAAVIPLLINFLPFCVEYTVSSGHYETPNSPREYSVVIGATNQSPGFGSVETVMIRGHRVPVKIVTDERGEEYLETYWEDENLGLRVIADYVCDLFRVDLSCLGLMNDHRIMFDWLCNRQSFVHELKILDIGRISDEDFEYVVQNSNSDFLVSDAILSKNFRMENFNKKAEFIALINCHWITIDNLMTMDARRIDIPYGKMFNNQDINRFLKHWMSGGSSRLKQIQFDFENYNENEFLEGINVRESTPEERFYSGFYEFDLIITNTVYIVREDGTVASFGVNDINLFFIAVWPDYKGKTFEPFD
uniref:MICOS complex subunit MIC60 n=1 Tax=Caenorhabditis tropicalis TaxID=1561998 RepID=A0A1I7SZB8_9PELO